VVSSTSSRCSSATENTEPLALERGEADILALEASAFARALTDARARERYERLASTVASDAVVPNDLVPSLETMLELLFERGRPSNPLVLQAIFGKTPRGRQRTQAALDVNSALATLRGQTLVDMRLSSGPAHHTLILETDRCRLTLELDPAAARIANLETG
jgi:hypothetical protein